MNTFFFNRQTISYIRVKIIIPIWTFHNHKTKQIISGFIFLIEIYVLEYLKDKERPPWAIYGLFFILSALLINFHAAMWPMMSVFILPYLAESIFGARIPWSHHSFLWKWKFTAGSCQIVCMETGTETPHYRTKNKTANSGSGNAGNFRDSFWNAVCVCRWKGSADSEGIQGGIYFPDGRRTSGSGCLFSEFL